MEQGGKFVISLDFELLWGVFDVVDFREKIAYFENTRQVIPEILDLFERYNIHATWAVVGMLLNKNWDEWEKNKPRRIPAYKNSNLSPYLFVEGLSNREKEEISDLVFAPELIQAIKSKDGQEIGTHTYSHFYCLEEGQHIKDFEEDLKKAVELAEEKKIVLKTLIFPRNQMQKTYLKVCSELGIETVRSNPRDWYWRDTLSENFVTKLTRSGDAYLPFGKKTYSVQKDQRHFIHRQPASRFLRPVESYSFLRKLKLERIKMEITRAAKYEEVYHLWWHPHNFGANPEESLNDLDHIFQHFKKCQEKYGFQSCNMQEINENLSY